MCVGNKIKSISRTGSLLATTCKDKKLRIIDPRLGEVLREGDSHQGNKASKVFIYLFTFFYPEHVSNAAVAMYNIYTVRTQSKRPLCALHTHMYVLYRGAWILFNHE